MEFTKFKINQRNKSAFENEFKSILSDNNIPCNQWEFNTENDLVIVEIPTICIEKMTSEHIELLKSFVV